jgi:TonB family protein
MALSRFVLVCLSVTSCAALVGCGSAPTTKQPNSSTAATGSSGPNTSSTTAATANTPPPAETTGTAGEAPAEHASTSGPGTVPLVGSLSHVEVETAIGGNMDVFDPCYTLGADKQGKLEGSLTVKAVVGPNGGVKDTSIQKSTMKNSKVDKCVADAFRKIKFPQSKGGVTVVTYPMKFGGEMVGKK